MTDLSIGGETFNVLIEGDTALPVVMLSHSLGADLHLWDDQVSELLKHFRVLRYDARGHGGSVADPGPYSIARLGRDALAILDALDIETVHWIGISKGGVIGQWLLINAPERIERAVLANTAAQFGAAEAWNDRIIAAKTDGLAALGDATMTRWFGESFRRNESDRVASVKERFQAMSVEGYAAACAALRDVDLREDLRGIEHPVLVITGRDDESITPAQTEYLTQGLANAALVTLEARHISNIEAADAFNKAVVDFLSAKTTRRPHGRTAAPRLPTPRRPAGRRSPATRGATVDAPARRAAPPIVKSKAARVTAATRGKVSPAISKAKGSDATTAKQKPAAPKAVLSAAKPKAGSAKTAQAVSKRATSAKAPARSTKTPAIPKTAVTPAKPPRGAATPPAKTIAKKPAKPSPTAKVSIKTKTAPINKTAAVKVTRAKAPPEKARLVQKTRTKAKSGTEAPAARKAAPVARKPAKAAPAVKTKVAAKAKTPAKTKTAPVNTLPRVTAKPSMPKAKAKTKTSAVKASAPKSALRKPATKSPARASRKT